MSETSREKISILFVEISALMIGSLIGLWVRVHLDNFFKPYLLAPIYSLNAAQFVGCVVVGFAVTSHAQLVRLHHTAYLLLTTGIAGSMTSFSGWAGQITNIIANGEKSESIFAFPAVTHILNVHSTTSGSIWLNVLVNITCTLALANGGFRFGALIGPAISEWYVPGPTPSVCPLDDQCPPARRCAACKIRHRHTLCNNGLLIIALATIFWLLTCVALTFFRNSHTTQIPHMDMSAQLHSQIRLQPTSSLELKLREIVLLLLPSPSALAAMFLAPIGCILRWRLSLYLNNRVTTFICLGTFVANACASPLALSTLLTQRDLQEQGLDEQMHVSQILQGVRDGLCGCLSTLSTVIGEMSALSPLSAFTYALSSIVFSQVLNFLLLYVYSLTTS